MFYIFRSQCHIVRGSKQRVAWPSRTLSKIDDENESQETITPISERMVDRAESIEKNITETFVRDEASRDTVMIELTSINGTLNELCSEELTVTDV